MRKLILALIFIGLLVCGCAWAEGPTNPYFDEAQAPIPVLFSRGESKKLVVGIVRDSVLEYDSVEDGGSWRATAYYEVTDDEGNVSLVAGTFNYCFYITMPEGDASITHGYQPFSTTRTFSYDFVIPGNYHLWVYARDSEGKTSRAVYSISVKDDSAITLEEKINQIVKECKAAGCTGDYEKALWLHDWLINNSYYDYSLSYYSADGVLIRGTGVCDSYSRAYMKLLTAAGIRCEYLPSTEMNHSWNQVLLDGKWYHIDTTWDDATPNGVTKPVCGLEKHIYFGLNDELMRYDHQFYDKRDCTSLDANYFIHSGSINKWSDGLKSSAQTALDASISGGYDSFAITPPEEYSDEYGRITTLNREIIYGLCAHALDEKAWDSGSYTCLEYSAKYDMNADKLRFYMMFGDQVLELPSALKNIGEEAFAGSETYRSVIIPDGTLTIGKGAFSNCKTLWNISIPASVTSIASDAFAGSPNVNIVCEAGSAAETFAKTYHPEHYRIAE